MQHMVQAIAVEERVRPYKDLRTKEHDKPVEDLKPADGVQTTQDTAKLLKMMFGKVTEIWSKIPTLKSVKRTLPDESHQYTEQISKITNYVSMRYVFFHISALVSHLRISDELNLVLILFGCNHLSCKIVPAFKT